jgi:integrase
MADGRRNRGTSRHEGVILLPRVLPSGRTTWRARFIDPDTRKSVRETLPDDLTTEEARTRWAIDKANEIQRRKDQLGEGAPTKKGMALEEAVERYYRDIQNLRPATLKVYRAATDEMLEWARHERIEVTDDIRGESLASLKSWLINKPGYRQAKGGRVETGKGREAWSVNRDIRGIKAALEHLRRNGLLPFVPHDAIRDNMKTLRTPKPVPEFLKTSVLARLVDAARRHDADVFDLTRDEKARGLTSGDTRKFQPVLPYIAVLLLSGMRADEARLLRWDQVDVDALPAGNITLKPEAVKTRHGRVVDLVVSPVLRDLLKRMGGKGVYVFGDAQDEETGEKIPALTRTIVEAARKRLFRKETSKKEKGGPAGFGGPRFTWQQLRVTCGTFLANAPGIFGAASAYREARQLGHSVAVAEKHYLGVVHVDPNAKTLEAAMGIEEELREALGL